MTTKQPRVYGSSSRGRRVSAPAEGRGKIVQAYLDPELAAKFFEYCREFDKGPATVIPHALRVLFGSRTIRPANNTIDVGFIL